MTNGECKKKMLSCVNVIIGSKSWKRNKYEVLFTYCNKLLLIITMIYSPI